MPKIKKSKKRVARPLHKRIVLHPVSILLFLCTGVLITMSTLPIAADSLTVTAKVAAPLVTSPATITSYYNQEHTTTQSITISGNCSSQTAYVNLIQNNTLTGTSDCTNGSYAVQVTLAPGANQLQVVAFNSTNDEGPTLPAITVFYDNVLPASLPTSPPPASPSISTVDGVSYSSRRAIVTSTRPTFRGRALAYSKIMIRFRSSTITCGTQADQNGDWSCTIPQALPPGAYSVDITITTPDGRSYTLPTIQIIVESTVPSLLKPGLTSPNSAVLTMIYAYQYQIQYPGGVWRWDIRANGGTLPYNLTVEWGDGGTMPSQNVGTSFTLTHTFDHAGTYHVIVRLNDSSGQTASLQLLAIVRAYPSPVASTTPRIIEDIRSYLWIIWPAYIIIFLMIVSFWLGESEAFKLALKMKSRRRHHTHR